MILFQSWFDVIAECACARVKQIKPVKVVQPKQRIALPEMNVSFGKMRHVGATPVVTGNGIECLPVEQAESSFAVYQYLTVGEFYNLMYLSGRQAVVHRPLPVNSHAYRKMYLEYKKKKKSPCHLCVRLNVFDKDSEIILNDGLLRPELMGVNVQYGVKTFVPIWFVRSCGGIVG